MKKSEEILEGEIVNDVPQKSAPKKERKRTNFNGFNFATSGLPFVARMNQNCSWGCSIFVLALILAFVLANPLVLLLGVLLIWWKFSRKK